VTAAAPATAADLRTVRRESLMEILLLRR